MKVKSGIKIKLVYAIFFLILLVNDISNYVVAEKLIKIGAMLHLTGEFPMQGKAFQNGALLAEKILNEKYNHQNIRIKVIIEDSQYKPITANLVGKKLLDIDQVDAAIVGTLTEVMSSGAAFEKAKVPLIVLWDSAPEIDQLGKYIFGIGPWSPSTGEVAAEYAFKKLNSRNVVIIGQANPWPLSVATFFTKQFQKLGGEVIQEIFTEPNEIDFRTVLLKAKNLNPDMIYCLIPANIVSFFKQAKQIVGDIPLVTGDNLTQTIINELGKDANGLYQTQVADPDSEVTQNFIKLYTDHYGSAPEMLLFSAWAYDAINLLTDKLILSDLNSERAAQELYNVDSYAGASGNITINSEGSSLTRVKMFRVENGSLKLQID